ncbi:52 kDa repressor of the inhibitor of the protein kinase-like [Mytilus trossulus]|uniref:52 kDa repressor of the inhibitor of the protein kinase-like n=1 Tax=Mytilus trossulus TaxID=6551 RepID=UPI003005DB7B
MEIDTQFAVVSTKCMKLFALVQLILCEKNMQVSHLQGVVDVYKNDLPSPELIDEEFFAWKLKSQQMQERPSTCRNAIKLCAKEHFPNIYVLLKIACTLPITSCECERSFSVMRRLNNYMRASMNHYRLSSLALLHIHYDTELIEKFVCLHPRRLELKNIIYN